MRRRTKRRSSRRRRTRKHEPWAGWAKLAPGEKERKEMLYKCGKKCFLGPKISFPVCAKGTCKINKKGLYAAYIRARQWGKKKSSYKGETRPTKARKTYRRVANRAKSLLKKRGIRVH